MCVLYLITVFFFFKQKTAYEMRISDWSSDVCSSDLPPPPLDQARIGGRRQGSSCTGTNRRRWATRDATDRAIRAWLRDGTRRVEPHELQLASHDVGAGSQRRAREIGRAHV